MAALRYMSGRELATRRTQREAQLAWIEEQVASGELVIRQATPEERARYGIAPVVGCAPPPPRRQRTSAGRELPGSGREPGSAPADPDKH